MKIVANQSMRFGTRRFEEGEEIELPDKLANALVANGKATAASEKKPKKAKKGEEPPEEEPPAEDRKAYKTRQIKAEDSD